jgi:hypothetical protein
VAPKPIDDGTSTSKGGKAAGPDRTSGPFIKPMTEPTTGATGTTTGTEDTKG